MINNPYIRRGGPATGRPFVPVKVPPVVPPVATVPAVPPVPQYHQAGGPMSGRPFTPPVPAPAPAPNPIKKPFGMLEHMPNIGGLGTGLQGILKHLGNRPPQQNGGDSNPMTNAFSWANAASDQWKMQPPDPNKAIAGANVYQQSLQPAFNQIDQNTADEQRKINNQFGASGLGGAMMGQVLDSGRRAGLQKAELQRQSMEGNIDRGRGDLTNMSDLIERRRGDLLSSGQRAGEFQTGQVQQERQRAYDDYLTKQGYSQQEKMAKMNQEFGLQNMQAQNEQQQNLMKQQLKAQGLSTIFSPIIKSLMDSIFPQQEDSNTQLLRSIFSQQGGAGGANGGAGGSDILTQLLPLILQGGGSLFNIGGN